MRKDEMRTYVAVPGGFSVSTPTAGIPARASSAEATGTGSIARRTVGGAEMDVESCAGDELGDAAESPGQHVWSIDPWLSPCSMAS